MTTKDKLIDAALVVLGERGYNGATTRLIAATAGLSEMTLFRHFPTKRDLTEAALERATEPFRAGSAELSDDVAHDLIQLAEGYVGFVVRWPELLDRLLPENIEDEELRPTALGLLSRNAKQTRALMAHHQQAGRLAEDPIEDLVRSFLGPLMMRATMRQVLRVDDFVADRHVERFLSGHAGSS